MKPILHLWLELRYSLAMALETLSTRKVAPLGPAKGAGRHTAHLICFNVSDQTAQPTTPTKGRTMTNENKYGPRLELWGASTVPEGCDLSSVTALTLGKGSTVPDGSDLSSVTTLLLWDGATVPDGSDLSSVTTLLLWDRATVPKGIPSAAKIHRY